VPGTVINTELHWPDLSHPVSTTVTYFKISQHTHRTHVSHKCHTQLRIKCY